MPGGRRLCLTAPLSSPPSSVSQASPPASHAQGGEHQHNAHACLQTFCVVIGWACKVLPKELRMRNQGSEQAASKAQSAQGAQAEVAKGERARGCSLHALPLRRQRQRAQRESRQSASRRAQGEQTRATWLTRATWGTCGRVPPARSPRSCEAAAHEHGAFLLSSRCCRHTPAACPLCAVPCSPVAWPRRRGQKHVHVYTLVLVTTPSTSSETIATGDTDYPYHSPRPLTRGGEHLQAPSRSRGHGDQVALVAMS